MASERHTFALACETCKERNYYFARGKKRDAASKLKIKKFCKKCGKQTKHKEIKA